MDGWERGGGITVHHVEVSFLERKRELRLSSKVMSLLLCKLKGLGSGHGVSLVTFYAHGQWRFHHWWRGSAVCEWWVDWFV